MLAGAAPAATASPRRTNRWVPSSRSRAPNSSGVNRRRSDSWLPIGCAPAGPEHEAGVEVRVHAPPAGPPRGCQVDQRHHHRKSGDAALLGRLPQRRAGQVGVAVDVAPGLEPPLELAVEQQQHPPTGGVDHQGGAGQVPLGAGPQQRVGMAGRGTGGSRRAPLAEPPPPARRPRWRAGPRPGPARRPGRDRRRPARRRRGPAHPQRPARADSVVEGRPRETFGSPATYHRQACSVPTRMPTRLDRAGRREARRRRRRW